MIRLTVACSLSYIHTMRAPFLNARSCSAYTTRAGGAWWRALRTAVLAPLLALTLLPVLAACGPSTPGGASGSGSNPKRVLTTFTILQDMAQEVAGDRAIVDCITKPGAEIHDYEPTPRDVLKAQRADLVLRNGLGLERWFEKFMGAVRDVPSAELSAGITPIGIGGGPYEGRPNPHAWMSPANAVIYVQNIRDALMQLDPANADTYRANAETYIARIRAVGDILRTTLEAVPPEQRWLVTSEGAFSYLARDYGLRELFLWPVNADEEGTPQQVRRVVDGVRAHHIPVCFSESTISDRSIRQVCAETGARYGGVLYVDSLTLEDGPAPTFLKLLEYNARTIARGLRP